jgi:hypothetical protein
MHAGSGYATYTAHFTDPGGTNEDTCQQIIRKAQGLMVDMRNMANIRLTRNDQLVYVDELEKDLTAGDLTAAQRERNWTNLMHLGQFYATITR